jgi:hypothetical protein
MKTGRRKERSNTLTKKVIIRYHYDIMFTKEKEREEKKEK